MAIRIREIDGVIIALCAVESDPQSGDLYLDDGIHYALATKFAEDWKGETQSGGDAQLVALMETQKMRDCKIEAERWGRAAAAFQAAHPKVIDFGWEEIKPYYT